ncbi:tripartite tricarboxylate transporter TctB family protein [Arsenicitalea aurantiaca]|uniref:Tripartite tricarboxylate transporter TctB family protein n=1 Tax=Arsenicitalea aurantiaca TaxID=1783274 RepID=A0A433X479_9HYPH|nr:tripartite tricarboxylate transporter TctB family protein [Arsenicitalea aurantiaca]RUT28862.1 tripartite tricarboxylate transporter TctB family protein [Arsenicitalea aurantiaca]
MSNIDRPTRGWLSLEAAISLAIVIAGLVFAGFGLFRYGFWQNNGPGAGFFPTIAGLLAAGGAGIELVRRSGAELGTVRWRDFSPFVAAVIAVLMVPVIGMTEAMTLFVLIWIRFVEKRSWIQALLSAAIALAIVYLLFGVWLGIRFPDTLVPSLFAMLGGW